jgi:hypothetical protein
VQRSGVPAVCARQPRSGGGDDRDGGEARAPAAPPLLLVLRAARICLLPPPGGVETRGDGVERGAGRGGSACAGSGGLIWSLIWLKRRWRELWAPAVGGRGRRSSGSARWRAEGNSQPPSRGSLLHPRKKGPEGGGGLGGREQCWGAR